MCLFYTITNVIRKLFYREGMETCFPGYNVSPVPQAWNRPGLREEGRNTSTVIWS